MADNSLASCSPRGVLSTILMTLVGSTVGGFLWIGRPRLAILSFVLPLISVFAVTWYGFPAWHAADLDVESIAWIALTAASVLLVLVFRKSSRPTKWHSRWYFALLIAFVIPMTIAISIRSFVMQPFSAPSSSMAPALVEGDRFFVSKSAYGYSKHSLPFDLVEFPGRIWSSVPQRGDIVILRHDTGLDYVKRVIGLPGETIRVSNGVLHINGAAVELRTKAKANMTLAAKQAALCAKPCLTEFHMTLLIYPQTVRLTIRGIFSCLRAITSLWVTTGTIQMTAGFLSVLSRSSG